MTEREPERQYSPQEDPQTGESSELGRDRWDLRVTLRLALLIVGSYGLAALIALAIRELWG